MINNVILVGRLVRDPQLRTTTSGKYVASYTVAVDSYYQDGQASFISVISWNKQAEFVKSYFLKGQSIAIEGSLQTRSYQNKDGQSVYVTEVVTNRVSFVGSKKENEQYHTQQNTTSIDKKAKDAKLKAAQEIVKQATQGKNIDSFNKDKQTAGQKSNSNAIPVSTNKIDPFAQNMDTVDISDEDLPF